MRATAILLSALAGAGLASAQTRPAAPGQLPPAREFTHKVTTADAARAAVRPSEGENRAEHTLAAQRAASLSASLFLTLATPGGSPSGGAASSGLTYDALRPKLESSPAAPESWWSGWQPAELELYLRDAAAAHKVWPERRPGPLAYPGIEQAERLSAQAMTRYTQQCRRFLRDPRLEAAPALYPLPIGQAPLTTR